MNLAFADRDFYYGDPAFPPDEPMRGLLSKEYARARAKLDQSRSQRSGGEAGRSVSVPGRHESVQAVPRRVAAAGQAACGIGVRTAPDSARAWEDAFYAGTTSIQAADAAGWVISITPSGGWIPAVIAGRTGIGLSQRAQSFVLDPAESPFNVIEPGKRPRVTLTPTLAMKDGLPWMAFSVQGGDSQDQNLLQCFLNIVEFGMTPQQAVEAPNMNSFQMRNSFQDHTSQPGRMLVASLDVRRRSAPSCRRWATRCSSPSARRVPSPRSGSIASTARCGAPRAITARTTASPGEKRLTGSGLKGSEAR